jgi:hypothetical protein
VAVGCDNQWRRLGPLRVLSSALALAVVFTHALAALALAALALAFVLALPLATLAFAIWWCGALSGNDVSATGEPKIAT